MADEFDQAQQREEADRQDALDRVLADRRRMDAKGAVDCIDCGDEIPKARRRVVPGARRCVQCQSAHERAGGG
jgi:phage/conjugal plasmid C-4 type zinc finger TraR family protein